MVRNPQQLNLWEALLLLLGAIDHGERLLETGSIKQEQSAICRAAETSAQHTLVPGPWILGPGFLLTRPQSLGNYVFKQLKAAIPL